MNRIEHIPVEILPEMSVSDFTEFLGLQALERHIATENFAARAIMRIPRERTPVRLQKNQLKEDGVSHHLTPALSAPFTGGKYTFQAVVHRSDGTVSKKATPAL